MFASCCLVSMYLIWILGSRLILSINQSRATLWVLDTCLIVGLCRLVIILIKALLSSKKKEASHRIDKASRSTKHHQHYSTQDWCAWLDPQFVFGYACLMWCHATSFLVLDLWVFFHWVGEEWKTSITKSQRSRAGFPSMCKPASRENFQLLLSCVRPKSVSCTSNFLVQMFDFHKYTRHLLMLILNLLDLLQNHSLEAVLICNVVLITKLPAFTCVMNVWDQTCLTFVTSFCRFRYRTSKFVHRP